MAEKEGNGGAGEIASVVQRNIRALIEVRHQFERKKTFQERVADTITRFTGSMVFVTIHAVAFAVWLIFNSRHFPSLPKWDPYPFVMLAMVASVEAIFLSTFVLISQNRMAALSEKRAELDLQINLLAEHEVTRLIDLTERIALRLDIPVDRAELAERRRDVEPDAVLHQIDELHEKAPE